VDQKDVDLCLKVLTQLVDNGEEFAALPKETQIELMKIAGQLSRPDVHQLKQRKKAVLKKKKQQIIMDP